MFQEINSITSIKLQSLCRLNAKPLGNKYLVVTNCNLITVGYVFTYAVLIRIIKLNLKAMKKTNKVILTTLMTIIGIPLMTSTVFANFCEQALWACRDTVILEGCYWGCGIWNIGAEWGCTIGYNDCISQYF